MLQYDRVEIINPGLALQYPEPEPERNAIRQSSVRHSTQTTNMPVVEGSLNLHLYVLCFIRAGHSGTEHLPINPHQRGCRGIEKYVK